MDHLFYYTRFFALEKMVYQFRTKVGLSSECPSVGPCVYTFLVNVSPPKPLVLATSNIVPR